MMKSSHFLLGIVLSIAAWSVQPIGLTRVSFLGVPANAQLTPSKTAPSKAADPNKVINDLKNYQSIKIQVGSNTFLVDKSDMTHFLTRHHPSYWDGSVKTNQTFFNKSATISDVEQAIKAVMKAATNTTKINATGTNGIDQLSDTEVSGVTYVLGLNKGHVGQFYPKIP